MISDPASQILYACVSKGPTVVAELRSGDPDLDALAAQCLESAPQFHLHYSHAAGHRIYAFLMVESFVYFAIANPVLGRRECLRFLERLRLAFSASILKYRRADDPIVSMCFDEDFGPVFSCLLPPPSLSDAGALSRDQSNQSKRETVEKKKIEDNAVVPDVMETWESKKIERADRDVELKIGNGGLNVGSGGRRESACRMWRRQVRVILLFDIVVCILLFGIWLSVCKGFQCIQH